MLLLRQLNVMCLILQFLSAGPISALVLNANAQRSIAYKTFRTVIASHPCSRILYRHDTPVTAMKLSVEGVSDIMQEIASSEIVQEMASEASNLADLADESEILADEAEILSDVGHVSSDLVVFFEPETVILRLSVVVGRLLEIVSDYLEDKHIRNDELAFDILLMGASLFLLWRSAAPIVQARNTELSELDCDVFEQCFKPVGVTLLQFKTMKATGCFEWITCSPGTVLVDENDDIDWQYLYWQYEGEVIRSFRGNVFSIADRANGKNIDDRNASGLFGDMRFLSKLDEQEEALALKLQGRKIKNEKDAEKETVPNELSKSPPNYPYATTTIGSREATLLRIDSNKLFDLMENDQRLDSSIRRLLLKSLQRKIGNLLYAQEKLFRNRK